MPAQKKTPPPGTLQLVYAYGPLAVLGVVQFLVSEVPVKRYMYKLSCQKYSCRISSVGLLDQSENFIDTDLLRDSSKFELTCCVTVPSLSASLTVTTHGHINT